MQPKTRVDLDRARDEIAWVDDSDVGELETKSRLGAALLGFFTWGGGRIYLNDYTKGGLGVGALVGWLALSGVLPAALGPLVYVAVGTVAALWSNEGARKMNRFLAIRNELRLREGPGPAGYRLLAGAAAADPNLAGAVPAVAIQAPATGPHAPTIERLRKLSALHQAGVINQTELHDRKVDIFTELGGANVDPEDLLFALLPLRDEGVLVQDDFEFLKQVVK